jgi:excisionase family DNA binding protein
MKTYSTREAAEKLGLHLVTVQSYIAAGKIPAPPLLQVGAGKLRIWSKEDIERVRRTLPKIANGRKTRYQRLREKKKGTQAGAPALQEKSEKKKGPKKNK